MTFTIKILWKQNPNFANYVYTTYILSKISFGKDLFFLRQATTNNVFKLTLIGSKIMLFCRKMLNEKPVSAYQGNMISRIWIHILKIQNFTKISTLQKNYQDKISIIKRAHNK